MSEQTPPLRSDDAAPQASEEPVRRRAPDRTRLLTTAGLTAILLIAAFLRLTHVNWDDNGHLHPDERFLTSISTETKAPSSPLNYFDTDTSALNPYNIVYDEGRQQTTFVYGTLPLFLNKLMASNLSTITLGQFDNYDNYDHYNRSGRALSAIFDLGTIVFTFLLGWRLINRGAGLMAGFLYAFSPFAIQNSHFFIVDPFVGFFATATIYFGVRSAQSGGYRNFMLAGLSAGLATACKTTAVALGPVVILAVGVRAWPAIRPYLLPLWTGDRDAGRDERDGRALDGAVWTFVIGSAAALFAGFVAYRIAMPYAFQPPDLLDWFTLRRGHLGPLPFPYPDIMNQHWVNDIRDQNKLLSGDAAFPPNVQWIGRSKWLWPAQQMVAWGMGPAFGITAWAGLALATLHAVRTRAWVWLVPLSWVIGYFGFMGMQFSLYMRYFLPLYPTLAVMAAFALHRTWEWGASDDPFARIGRLRGRLRPPKPLAPLASRVAIGSVLVLTMAAGLAFYSIYTRDVTRVEASRWVHQNVPEGAVIGHEHWDDVVPFSVPGVPNRSYGSVEFENFNHDTPERVEQLLLDIEAVDYIALSSARLSGTITRAPAVWPITSRYYETLESGELGFKKVAEFDSYARIFGLEFDDTGAEESFSVYDHPKVVIYEKSSDFSIDRARKVLGADAFIPGVAALPGDASQNALLFRPDVAAEQRAGGTYADLFDPGSLVNRYPALFWLLIMELAALSLVPLALIVFRALPDRGYLLTKPLGILLLAYFVYAPAGLGLAGFSRQTITFAMVFLTHIGMAMTVRRRKDVFAFVRERWRFIVLCEAVFLLMFLFSYWLRLQNPDLFHPYNGGEKPMDFTYFNGVLRSTDLTQGPIDPWYAGGYLNYYWWGFFIAATPTKLLGVMPEVAYNLVVPMFFSLSAAAVFSVTYNLTEATRAFMKRRPDRTRIHARGPILAALLAVFLVMIAGNLRAIDYLGTNFGRVSPWHSDIPIVGSFVAIAGGFWEVVFGDASFRELVYGYDWWGPSRALMIVPGQENTVQPITEFPFWTFLFADLHAHLMAIPFSLTAVGVAVAAVLNFTRLHPDHGIAERQRGREMSGWVMVAVIGLIVGALRWINSWDYPPFLLLGAAAFVIGERARDGRLTVRGLATAGAKTVVMVGLSFVLFTTVLKSYSQSYNGFHQSDQTTDLSDFMSHFGVFLFLVAALVTVTLHRAIGRDRWLTRAFFGRRRGDVTVVLLALLLAGMVLVWLGTRERWGVTLLSVSGLIAIILCAVREFRSPSPAAPVLLMVYAMIALGLGLTGGVEMLTLDGDVGRMNTVFKFYLHVWLLWGIASAYGLWYVFDVMRPQRALRRTHANLGAMSSNVLRYGFAGVAAFLLVLTLVYPYFGTRARVHNRFNPAQGASNDGLAWLDEAGVYDNTNERGNGGKHELKYTRDAITWLREHVEGSPTTIEAIGESYRSLGSRVAIYTGLPTVSGWGFHQSQQRVKFHVTVDQRQADVREFYSTEDVGLARQILARYRVEWVILGDEERFNYPAEGMTKFQNGLGGALELAYENPAVQIFHVIPEDELEDASAAAP